MEKEISDKEVFEALDTHYKAMDEEQKEIELHNRNLLKSLGYPEKVILADLENIVEITEITGRIEVVDRPKGDPQGESYKIFKNVHVDQWTGFCEDDYYGNIYVQVLDKWYRIPYEC